MDTTTGAAPPAPSAEEPQRAASTEPAAEASGGPSAPAAETAPSAPAGDAPKDELPLRAEDAVAKLKGKREREREHSGSPEDDNAAKRHKGSAAEPADGQATERQTTEPQSIEPSAPEPQTREPLTTEPQTAEPQTTEPQTTKPQGAEPPSQNQSLKAPAREVSIDSNNVLQSVAGLERRVVGSVVYEPKRLLALGHELNLNCVLQVRVGHEFLRRDAEPVRRRALWGSQVYTDDSDLVAVLAHEGLLPAEPEAKTDLSVDVLLLPVLERYAGSFRHGVNSREWRTRHDGISYMVLGQPRAMPAGWSFSGVEQQMERIRLLAEARAWKPVELAYAE